MSELVQYVLEHTERGGCRCGRCLDAPETPVQPRGHTAEMVFFKVAAKPTASAEELRRLLGEHRGEFCQMNPFDGAEHSYLEVGGWVGDQGVALMLMGLGTVLGLWELYSPVSVLGLPPESSMAQQLATGGMITIRTVATPAETV